MSQESVLKLLRKKRRWITSREIQEELNLGDSAVNRTLKVLLKHNEIQRKEEKMSSGRKKNFLGYKWRMKK